MKRGDRVVVTDQILKVYGRPWSLEEVMLRRTTMEVPEGYFSPYSGFRDRDMPYPGCIGTVIGPVPPGIITPLEEVSDVLVVTFADTKVAHMSRNLLESFPGPGDHQ